LVCRPGGPPTSNVEVGQTTYPVNRGRVGRKIAREKSQRGGEGRREWNRGDGRRALSSRGRTIVQGPTEIIVTPLLMRPVCLFIQGRFEEPVRPCK